ncbi:MAG: phosphate/phosphite/phosphonate ABC transporter substrate-binding protein, partial [Nitrospinota bacterium]
VYLRRHGIEDMGRYFGRVVYAGSHDVSIMKILDGEVDAGAAKDLVFKKLAAENPRISRELAVIVTSPPVPETALALRSDLHIACLRCHPEPKTSMSPTANAEKPWSLDLVSWLRRELLDLDKTPEGRKVLAALGADRFVPTTVADYKNLYDMIQEVGLDLKQY